MTRGQRTRPASSLRAATPSDSPSFAYCVGFTPQQYHPRPS
jgi:hypothetical protein